MDGGDHKFLQSKAFIKGAVGVSLKGNSWQYRFLKEHARICTTCFRRAGVEVTEAHRLLIARLGRIALHIEEFERRLDKGGISEDELRFYASFNREYLGVMRALVMGRPGTRPEAPSQPEPAGDAFAAILREVSG